MKVNEIKKIKEIAIKAAKKAGEILLKERNKKIKVSRKYKTDIVSSLDIRCEKKIINIIRSNYPNHQILSEEIKKTGAKSRFLWVIDPLDGTINYVAGQPLFSVSICLLYEKKPILGVVYAPCFKELFFAIKNGGAFLNNKKISVSKNKKLKDSIIYFTLSAHYKKKLISKTFSNCKKIISKIRGVRIYESGALSHCYVACGRLDGKISIKTDPYGSAAGALITKEAGGMVTDFNGNDWNIDKKSLVSSNGLIHKSLLLK